MLPLIADAARWPACAEREKIKLHLESWTVGESDLTCMCGFVFCLFNVCVSTYLAVMTVKYYISAAAAESELQL